MKEQKGQINFPQQASKQTEMQAILSMKYSRQIEKLGSIIYLSPKPILQSFFSLAELFYILELIQMCEHSHYLRKSVYLKNVQIFKGFLSENMSLQSFNIGGITYIKMTLRKIKNMKQNKAQNFYLIIATQSSRNKGIYQPFQNHSSHQQVARPNLQFWLSQSLHSHHSHTLQTAIFVVFLIYSQVQIYKSEHKRFQFNTTIYVILQKSCTRYDSDWTTHV